MTNRDIPEAVAESEQTGLLTLSVRVYVDPKLKTIAETVQAEEPSFEEIKPLLTETPLRFYRPANKHK